MGLVIGGRGMKAHGVGEGRVEYAVVAAGDLLEDGGEAFALSIGEGFDASDGMLGEEDEFEGPDSPEGNEGCPGIVFGDDALLLGELEGEVGGEELLTVRGVIGELGRKFESGLVGDVLGGPDLPVGMGIAGTHHGASIFEDLDVLDVGACAELGCLVGPHLDDAADGGDVHGGEREVVARIKAEDAADATLGFGADEAGAVDV
jgi:hypothetical protein